MHNFFRSSLRTCSALCIAFLVQLGSAKGADLGGEDAPPPAAPSEWSFTFTTYAWASWLSGDMTVKGRSFDVKADPIDIINNLDWSGLPAWMSYAEARRGKISLFNDIVYAKLSGSSDFAKSVRRRFINASLGGSVEVDDEQATVELGGAYEVWSGQSPAVAGVSAIDILGGARYWHQEVGVSGDLNATLAVSGPLGIIDLSRSGNRVFARSGSVDWVDPFVGARLRQQLAPGQELVLRGDIGGFGAGSDFSWQALATYNWQMCKFGDSVVDGYIGYRALSVDYEQGSGKSKYEYNVLQHGPVLGATLHF